MSLNESIVEYAALTWFGELGYAVGHDPHLAPDEPAGEYDLRPPGIAFKGETERSVRPT